VGALNGLILPIALTVMLIAARQSKLVNAYKHPIWLQIVGWLVVVTMSWMGYLTIAKWIA
jgi:Mn2+/Fe2+ NRAMP family transporter